MTTARGQRLYTRLLSASLATTTVNASTTMVTSVNISLESFINQPFINQALSYRVYPTLKYPITNRHSIDASAPPRVHSKRCNNTLLATSIHPSMHAASALGEPKTKCMGEYASAGCLKNASSPIIIRLSIINERRCNLRENAASGLMCHGGQSVTFRVWPREVTHYRHRA